jgi:hypothetical protein
MSQIKWIGGAAAVATFFALEMHSMNQRTEIYEQLAQMITATSKIMTTQTNSGAHEQIIRGVGTIVKLTESIARPKQPTYELNDIFTNPDAEKQWRADNEAYEKSKNLA